MTAIITKCSNDNIISTDEDKTDKLEIPESNAIGSNYLNTFYDCCNNLDIKMLNNNDLLILADKIYNFKLEIERKLYNRKML